MKNNFGLPVCRLQIEILRYTEMSVLLNHLLHTDRFNLFHKLEDDLKDLLSIKYNLIKTLKECKKQINYVSDILGKSGDYSNEEKDL